MRKFKHLKTGWTAIQIINTGLYAITVGDDKPESLHFHKGNIWNTLLEDSNDWQEIIEYPIGTKVRLNDFTESLYYEKTKNGGWNVMYDTKQQGSRNVIL